jgi:hypothetical protein
MSEERKRVRLDITLPQITPRGKKRAQDVANATFVFTVDGTDEVFAPSEVTEGLLRREAERIAAITDPQSRANEMFHCMASCVQMVAEAQKLGSEFAGGRRTCSLRWTTSGSGACDD